MKRHTSVWDDDHTPYGTYEGERGSSEQWKAAFEFVKLTKGEALVILQGAIESPYEILGIQSNATQDEIKTAMRSLVVKYHPDKGGDEEKFRKVMAAYTILKI
jgi:DnaJ-class molecular chaperone